MSPWRDVRSLPRRFSVAFKRSSYAFELLLERRVVLFVIADFLLLFQGLVAGLLGEGKVPGIYISAAIVPTLFLGIPVLSSTVALERRAGSLDLALATASTERYFLRRVLPVCALFIVQAWLMLGLAYLIVLEDGFWAHMSSYRGVFVVPVVIHAVLAGLLLGAVTLFWASRIRTTGGAMVASFVTVGMLSRWIFDVPFLDGWGPPAHWLLGVVPPVLLSVAWKLGGLALAIVLFYLYARDRLRRPELMLA